MVRDIGDLLGEEPRVERVEYDAHPRRTVPGGKMASTVPTHRRNAVAGLYPLRRERVRHALRVRADVGIGRSGDASPGLPRHDPAPAMPVRPEERRVGTACFRPLISRWS